MLNLQNKVAVITGSASGIGRAIAQKAAQQGMKLVLADIDEKALNELRQQLEAKFQSEILQVTIDVTQESDLQKLANETIAAFGIPHLLVNNAGVTGPLGPVWETPTEKLKWAMDVNLYGIIYSLQAFIPHMLELQEQAYIVNNTSMASFYTAPYLTSYEISKHAAIALTEALYHDLQTKNSKLHVSVLCPGWVNTQILNADRNSPFAAQEVSFEQFSAEDAKWILQFARKVRKGISPDKVADILFAALAKKQFYIFTHPDMKQVIKARLNAALEEKSPAQLSLS